MKFHRLAVFSSRVGLAALRDDGQGEPASEEKKPPISDDTYDRIPDKFKRPSENDARTDERDGRKSGGGGGGSPQEPKTGRRPTFAVLVFVLSLIGVLTIGYRSFFSPKSTEITWTAFNNLLDDGMIESAELTGGAITGTLRDIPELTEWIELIPEGRKLFGNAVADYDRMHPKQAKTFDSELESELDSLAYRIEDAPADEDGVRGVSVVLYDKSTDKVCDTARIPATASETEVDARIRDIMQLYGLRRKVDQRWELKPARASRASSTNQAMQMVDRKTSKPFGKTFFNNYTCQAPAFAFADGSLDARLRAKLRSYTSVPQTDNSVWLTLLSIGVTLLFFILIFRALRSTSDRFLNGNGMGVTQSLAKKYDPDEGKRATFDDVAGMEQVKAELVEVVDFLKNPEKYERMGARVPRGTLLFGPPGTGKTLLARAVAGEAGVPFYSINGSEFIQLFVGVGASRVRDLFSTARENAPAILFIDEIDAVGRQRGAGVGGGQDEREQTLNQILSEMDGFTQTDSVMVMASTNRPDVLDPALMRPGRFDRHITVGRPSMRDRVKIFKVYLKKIPYASDVDVDKLAAQTAGFTGADIRNYVNEATLWATRNNKDTVNSSDFDYAFEKIALGLKRDEIISPEDKRKTAVHESGHAIVGWFMPAGSKVHKVTIIPRGRALGVTWSLPEEDKLSYDASEAKATLAHLLAGRVAEKMIYGDTTSGVENDLQRATELARDMIARWGMSAELGPVSFPNSETHPFLGREMSTGERVYSEATAQLIDMEIKRFVLEADAVAERVITEHRDAFDRLVDALTAEEELDRERLVAILGPAPGEKLEEAAPATTESVDDSDSEEQVSDAAEDANASENVDGQGSADAYDDQKFRNLPSPDVDEN